MSNPYKETIVDEASGIEVPDQRHEIWEAGYKAGIRKAIKVYTPYVRALEEENGSLVGFASTHGWSSSQVEFGKQCRSKIKSLKASGKACLKENGLDELSC